MSDSEKSSLVLVTGASGFIGRHCVAALRARGHAVIGAGRGEAPAGMPWRRLDLMDRAQVRAALRELKPDMLLHCAWRPVRWDVMDAPDNVDWIAPSLALATDFHEIGGRRAAFLGSGAEYDWSGGVCRAGATPLAPASVYGASKLALFRALEAFALKNGLSFVWPRVFFVYGAGEHESRLAAYVMQRVRNGEYADCTHGRQVRDYLHVADVAHGVVTALVSEHQGAIDIASGAGVEVRELAEEIARQLGREDLLRFGARADAKPAAAMVIGDAGQARALGWAQRYSLSQGIAELIARSAT